VIPAGPFKGLVPFEDSEMDALLFFGRERESEIIAANVLAARLTVLYGPSGVGKSSVLRAGVARWLRRQARRSVEERGHPEFVVVVFDAWSEDPVASLRTAVREQLAEQFGSALLDEPEGESLANTLGRWTEALACDLLLVLDQAEEYFLYHAEETGFAQELPELVTRPGLRVRVLLALRDDALAKLDRFKARIPNLYSNSLRLDHLDRRAAHEAIVRPVERYNDLVEEDRRVEVEPSFVETVLDQTAAGRVDLGQAGRGLAPGETDESRIEAPYLQLVLQRVWEEELAGGSRRLRASTLDRLGGAEAIVRAHLRRAVDALSASEKDVAAAVFRYLVTPSGTKIAHGVGDLAEYALVDERRLLPVLTTLGHERIVRPVDSAGSNGARYEIFHDVLAEPVLAWRREREMVRERQEAETRNRRLFLLSAAALAALAAMTAVAIYAFGQRSDARAQRREAEAKALLAQALNQLGVDPERSLLLSLEAAHLKRTPQVEEVLRKALEISRVRNVRRAPPGGGPKSATAKGHVITVVGRSATLDGRVLPHPGVAGVAISPDGRLVATAGRDSTTRIWSVRTQKLVKTLRGHRLQVLAAAFSPDGKLFATGGTDGIARLYQVADWALVAPVSGHTNHVTSVAFSPKGDLLATGSRDGTARLWNTTVGRPVAGLFGHRDAVTAVGFSRDGKQVVTTSKDGTERIWDAEAEPTLALVRRFPRPISDAIVADDRSTLVTLGPTYLDPGLRFSRPGIVRILGTTGPSRVTGVKAMTIALGPDGVFIGKGAGGVGVFTFGGSARPVGTNLTTYETAVGARGQLLAVADGADEVSIWNNRTRAVVVRMRARGHRVTALAFSPDDSLLAGGAEDGSILVWLVKDGTLVHRFEGHRDDVTSVGFDPPGRRLVTTSVDHDARIWDLESERLLHKLSQFAVISRAGFSPDGRWVVTAGPVKAALWSASTGILETYLAGHTLRLTDARFVGEHRIDTASWDGTWRTYSCEICGNLDDLVALAKARLARTGRALTPDERRTFLRD
jgi:WD40 repeat protein